MRMPKWLFLILLIAVLAPLGGCARTMRNTEGFAIVDSAVVDAPFDETWQYAKQALRDGKYDIYTRDKRGIFVAYTPMKRNFLAVPKRTKLTVAVESVSDDSTKVSVESMRQVFGVTLLTYPGWHDRKTTDHSHAQKILEAVAAKASPAEEAAPAADVVVEDAEPIAEEPTESAEPATEPAS